MVQDITFWRRQFFAFVTLSIEVGLNFRIEGKTNYIPYMAWSLTHAFYGIIIDQLTSAGPYDCTLPKTDTYEDTHLSIQVPMMAARPPSYSRKRTGPIPSFCNCFGDVWWSLTIILTEKEKFVTMDTTLVGFLVLFWVRNGPRDHFLTWSIFLLFPSSRFRTSSVSK